MQEIVRKDHPFISLTITDWHFELINSFNQRIQCGFFKINFILVTFPLLRTVFAGTEMNLNQF